MADRADRRTYALTGIDWQAVAEELMRDMDALKCVELLMRHCDSQLAMFPEAAARIERHAAAKALRAESEKMGSYYASACAKDLADRIERGELP